MAALATVAGAFLAFLALKNWQLQDKAKRQAEFIDSLIETAHAFIAEMRKPITLVEFATFGFKGHEPLEQIGTDEEKATKGAILYIQRNGRDDAKRLLEALETVRISTVALRSLVAKGQVFQFKNYVECQNAVAMLTWQFDRMEAFATMLGSPTLNWANPQVLKALEKVISIQPDEVRKSLAENNVALIKFATETYKKIYG